MSGVSLEMFVASSPAATDERPSENIAPPIGYREDLDRALQELLVDEDMDPQEFTYQYRRTWDLMVKVGPEAACDEFWRIAVCLHAFASHSRLPMEKWSLAICKLGGIFAQVDQLILYGYARASLAAQLATTAIPMNGMIDALRFYVGTHYTAELRRGWKALYFRCFRKAFRPGNSGAKRLREEWGSLDRTAA